MDREQLRDFFLNSAVVRQRSSSLSAMVRGWRVDSAPVLGDPRAVQSAGRLLHDLTRHCPADYVVGIERSGTPLALSMAASAKEDGRTLAAGSIDAKRAASRGQRVIVVDGAPFEHRVRVILVDDTVNSGWTARNSVRDMEGLGTDVIALACLVRYSARRPFFLRRWEGPLLSVFDLRDLGLRRFTLARTQSASGRPRNGPFDSADPSSQSPDGQGRPALFRMQD